jgi:hypothetical protein
MDVSTYAVYDPQHEVMPLDHDSYFYQQPVAGADGPMYYAESSVPILKQPIPLLNIIPLTEPTPLTTCTGNPNIKHESGPELGPAAVAPWSPVEQERPQLDDSIDPRYSPLINSYSSKSAALMPTSRTSHHHTTTYPTPNPSNTAFSLNALTSRGFQYYITHSGAAMASRSSPIFFLQTVPQLAEHYVHVREALLAVALVDESVDDHATNASRNGPGVHCRDVGLRRASLEMYNRAIRSLVSAQQPQPHQHVSHKTDLEKDNALAAMLTTCLMLFSFENWLCNLRNAERHLGGAAGLIADYEMRMEGRRRGGGVLEEFVLPMMRQAMLFHEMSVALRVPASRFGEGKTWKPEFEGH